MIPFSFILDRQFSSEIIYLSIIVEGKEHLLKTPLQIAFNMWDQQKQCPKNIYLKSCKKLNTRLNRLRIAIAGYLNGCHIQKKRVSVITLTRYIKKYTANDDTLYSDNSLLFYIDSYIKSRKHVINESTFRRYMVFIRFLERYEGYICKNLLIEDVNSSFVRNFIEFGRKEAYNDSTLFRTIHFVKTILNYLEKRGIRTYVYEIELPKEKKIQTIVTLSEDELVKIKRMDMPLELQEARDWLIISCYTGQRISDFMAFSKDKLEMIDEIKCLSFVQQKTKKKILLPIHPAILTILSKYETMFPTKISPNKYNEKIKEIVRLAGITNLINAKRRKRFRVTECNLPKWEVITSHIGRRSFASNFYGKIPTPLLMETTGHSSEYMFHLYINQVNHDRAKSLSLYFDEVYKKSF